MSTDQGWKITSRDGNTVWYPHPDGPPEPEGMWDDTYMRTAAIITIASLGLAMLGMLIWLLLGGHEE